MYVSFSTRKKRIYRCSKSFCFVYRCLSLSTAGTSPRGSFSRIPVAMFHRNKTVHSRALNALYSLMTPIISYGRAASGPRELLIALDISAHGHSETRGAICCYISYFLPGEHSVYNNAGLRMRALFVQTLFAHRESFHDAPVQCGGGGGGRPCCNAALWEPRGTHIACHSMGMT